MNDLLADLKRLTGIPARCGREGPVAGAVRKGRERHGEVREDGLGNLGVTVGKGEPHVPAGSSRMKSARRVASGTTVIPASAGMNSARHGCNCTTVIPANAGIQSTQRIGRTSRQAQEDAPRRIAAEHGPRS